MFRTTSYFYAGHSEFRINSKFNNTLVVPESTVLPLADRWDQGPLSVSPSSSGSLFFLSPACFPGFLHRRRLAHRASRPYCGSARHACCRCSVHSHRGPVRCRHCSRIRLRTPAFGDERRWWTSPTVHRARAIKTAGVPLFFLTSGLTSPPPFSITAYRSSGEALMAEAMPDWFVILICGGLATLLGLSVLLCAMIFDEYCDAAAWVLALRGGGDHEE